MKLNSINIPSLMQSHRLISSKKQSSSASSPNSLQKIQEKDIVLEQVSFDDVSAEYPMEELKATVLERIVEGINEYLQSMDKRLSCYLHEPTGRIAVKVVNNTTGEVMKEIPAQKALSLATKLKEVHSLLFDEQI
ncbi:MAG: flagellar protein FlaG [Thermodesulfobacteriota bacterium]|nr:flagellar protein FlaG [Thermodesulfobacteriota bacterium]